MSRPFDPVFSAALRADLEAVADRAARPSRTPSIRRPQVWITVAVALALVAATLGVLRLTQTVAPPAHPGPVVVDPLRSITDPRSGAYVARAVHVLLDASGTGSGSRTFRVPATVGAVQTYLACAGGSWKLAVDHGGGMSSDCGPGDTSHGSFAIDPGLRTATVTVRPGVPWSVLVIERPAPTLSTGTLIDPAAAVLDPFDPDSIPGARILSDSGALPLRGDGVEGTNLPENVGRLRLFLVCTTDGTANASPAVTAVVDGHRITGCQNSIAHWFDFTPRGRDVEVEVHAPAGVTYRELLVQAPKGAHDSPESAALPYPAVQGAVLAQARGAGAAVSGTYSQPHDGNGITTTCRGTGWLEIQTGGSGTNTRGTACSTSHPFSTGFSGPDARGRHRFTVIPHGDISWTFQLTDAGNG